MSGPPWTAASVVVVCDGLSRLAVREREVRESCKWKGASLEVNSGEDCILGYQQPRDNNDGDDGAGASRGRESTVLSSNSPS